MLQHAASPARMSPDGFSFEVNLTAMPLRDLERWAENEQKCCSFLKIENQIAEDKKRVRVRVICPANLRSEVMLSLGLKA